MSNRAPRLSGVCAPAEAKGEVIAIGATEQGAAHLPAAHFPASLHDISLTAAAVLFLEGYEEKRMAARVQSVSERLAHAHGEIAASFNLVDVGYLFRALVVLERRRPDDPDGYPADARIELRVLARRLAHHVCGFRILDLSEVALFAEAAGCR